MERERSARPEPAPTVPEWSSEYDDRGRDRWASSSGSDAPQRSGRDDARRDRKGKRPKSKTKKAFDLLEDIFDF